MQIESYNVLDSVEVHIINIDKENKKTLFKMWQPKRGHSQFKIYEEFRKVHEHTGLASPFVAHPHALVFEMGYDGNAYVGLSVLARIKLCHKIGQCGMRLMFQTVYNMHKHTSMDHCIVDPIVEDEFREFIQIKAPEQQQEATTAGEVQEGSSEVEGLDDEPVFGLSDTVGGVVLPGYTLERRVPRPRVFVPPYSLPPNVEASVSARLRQFK